MPAFARDIDLLHWEPRLFNEAAPVAQTLVTGFGSLAGTQFTLTESLLGSLDAADAEVIHIGGSINGCFPIVSIDSSTQLTVSVLYDKLQADPPVPARIGPGAADIPFWIRTFWPQRSIVTEMLLQLLDLNPGQFSAVLNPQALRRACVLGALHMIYSALSAVSDDSPGFGVRADLYQRLYRRALRAARVELDLNSDGQPDTRRALGTLPLLRE